MKKFIFLFAIIIAFLSGCSDDFDQVQEQQGETVYVKDRVVSALQAQAFAEKAIEAIQTNGDTALIKNSVVRSIKSVEPIKALDGNVVLHIVNFEDNQGYMVLSADKEAPNPMLSFDVRGNFDPRNIDEDSPVWVWLEERKEVISENIKSGINEDHQGYELWNYIIENEDGEISIEIGSAEEMNNVKNESAQLRGTYPNPTGRPTISPWNDVRYNTWGQGAGYNADAPIRNALVGCPAVAIGILCKTHRYPSKYEYSSMPNVLNATSSNSISRMFRDIANNIPGYVWGLNSSGALPGDIITGLKRLGYNSAKQKSYDSWTAYANIRDWYPVLLAGYPRSGQGGHIWIADGYYEQTWKFTKKNKVLGITVSTSTWYEYMSTFYMNWGWNGDGDGWVDEADWSSAGYNYNKLLFYDLFPR